ncbi:MAG: MFS transporter [Thermodesulfovibrionales bacterium]
MEHIEGTGGPKGGPGGGASFSALYIRDFRLFWAGQVISFSGTWMHVTAQGWLVYSLTKSPFYLGVVAAASSLPIMLFSLLGGAVADRFRKRNLLLLTQGLSIIPALLIGVLTSMGTVTVWQVIGLGFFLGTVNAFDVPARQSFLVEMVAEGNLLNAVALNSAAFNGARIIGPVIAGLTIANIGLAACFYLNALSFLAVIGALSRVKARGERRTGGGGLRKEIREGMSFIMREPEVRRPMMLVGIFSLFGLPFVSQLPVFAEEILEAGAEGLGFLMGASGVGALSAALILAVRKDIRDKRRLMSLSSLAFAAALLLFSLSRDYMLSMAALVVVGFAVVSFLAIANSSIQLRTPGAMRGRVMSVYTLVFLGLTPIGHSVVGTVADFTGSAHAVLMAAAVCLGASLAIVMRGRKG